MVFVLAKIVVKPEFASEAATILQTLVAESRKEPGCISYELFQQADQPYNFQTVESWKDQAAVDGHMKTPHIGAAIAAATPMFAAAPAILTHHKLA